MSYTADALIAKRKEKWISTWSIEQDRKLREAIANEIVSDKALLAEVRQKPEKLIELVFVVVDKNQKTMPFFLNEVQKDFIERLNKAIEDYEKGLIPEISLLVLKGRQQGFTTLVTAYQLSCSISSAFISDQKKRPAPPNRERAVFLCGHLNSLGRKL